MQGAITNHQAIVDIKVESNALELRGRVGFGKGVQLVEQLAENIRANQVDLVVIHDHVLGFDIDAAVQCAGQLVWASPFGTQLYVHFAMPIADLGDFLQTEAAEILAVEQKFSSYFAGLLRKATVQAEIKTAVRQGHAAVACGQAAVFQLGNNGNLVDLVYAGKQLFDID